MTDLAVLPLCEGNNADSVLTLLSLLAVLLTSQSFLTISWKPLKLLNHMGECWGKSQTNKFTLQLSPKGIRVEFFIQNLSPSSPSSSVHSKPGQHSFSFKFGFSAIKQMESPPLWHFPSTERAADKTNIATSDSIFTRLEKRLHSTKCRQYFIPCVSYENLFSE